MTAGRRLRLATGLIALASLATTTSATAAPGDLDPSFGTGGMVTTDFGIGREEYGGDVAVDAAGRTVVVGNAETSTVDESSTAITRYTPAGAPDPTFGGGDGRVLLNLGPSDQDSAQAVTIDASGRIVLVGTTRDFLDVVVVRLTGTGQLDPAFGGGDGAVTMPFGSGLLSDVTIDPSGRIVAAGGVGGDMTVVRLTPDGSLDVSFAGDGIASVGFGEDLGHAYGVAVDGSARIVVGGGVEGEADGADFAVARLLGDGTPDTTFSGDGRTVTDLKSLENLDYPSGLALDASNRIVVVGSSIALPLGGPTHLALVRYATDGSLDPTFGDQGVVLDAGDSTGQGIAIDPSGRLLVMGYSEEVLDDALRRLLADGSPDSTFGGGDGVAPVPFGIGEAVALDPMRRITVAGSDWNGSDSDFAAARFLSGEAAPPFHGLSVSVGGPGFGRVAGPGIDCPGDCSESYAAETSVGLLAVPAVGSTFAGWSGDCSGVDGCQVTMDTAKAVAASFDPVMAEPEPLPPAVTPAAENLSQPQVSPGPQVVLAEVGRAATVRHGKVFLRLRCGGEAPCRGVAKLIARVRATGKAQRSARRARNIVLGRSRFRIPAGKAKTLRIRLNRKGRRLLRRAGRRGLRARLVGRGLRNRTVRLRSSKVKRHRRGRR